MPDQTIMFPCQLKCFTMFYLEEEEKVCLLKTFSQCFISEMKKRFA